MFARSLLAVALVIGAGNTAAQAAEWTVNVLNRFVTDDSGSENGYNPRLGILRDGSDIIGSTNLGGSAGGGVIYRRKSNGTIAPLYSFTTGDTSKGSCGYNPSAKLIMASSGVIYGTTFFGGEGSGGVVFSLTERSDPTAEWKCAPLKSFYNATKARHDGYNAFGGLFRNPNDNRLYGTAQSGGTHGGGVIFRLNPNGGKFEVLYNFNKSGNGGFGPAGPLAMDSTGALFGATFFRGASLPGVVYKLTPSGSTFSYKVIHTFSRNTSKNGARLGYSPTQGPLLIDSSDNLYGETTKGGCPDGTTNSDGNCPQTAIVPAGTLFKLTKSGANYTYSVLHTFDSDESGSANGYGPYGGLILKGTALYGVAQFGGTGAGGVAFRYFKGKYLVLHNFDPDNEGYMPSGALTLDSSGNLIGTNQNGGGDAGTLFEIQHP